jgi:hypothetical protein
MYFSAALLARGLRSPLVSQLWLMYMPFTSPLSPEILADLLAAAVATSCVHVYTGQL